VALPPVGMVGFLEVAAVGDQKAVNAG
jgi:hypothetical protein